MNIEDLQPLSFTHDWNNSDPETGFTTTEDSEARVRADIQMLHDETKNYINGPLRGALLGANALMIPATDPEGEASTVQAELDSIRSDMQGIVLGQIPDGSITAAKLAGGAAATWADISDQITLEPYSDPPYDTITVLAKEYKYNPVLGVVYFKIRLNLFSQSAGPHLIRQGGNYPPPEANLVGFVASVYSEEPYQSEESWPMNVTAQIRTADYPQIQINTGEPVSGKYWVSGWYLCDGPGEEEATT